MILIAIGSNISGPWGTSSQTVTRAINALNRDGIRLIKSSRLMVTAPYGKPNQPDFINAVVQVGSHLPPMALLRKLHAIERRAGRVRALRWGPRTLDLDIVDYHGLIQKTHKLMLPHPGIADRIFVLKPITELRVKWRHPTLRKSAAEMMRALTGYTQGQEV
jgi:2-amino-4-hydroxy-6-hydroxymethyldihydropteridine diphosphokinase